MSSENRRDCGIWHLLLARLSKKEKGERGGWGNKHKFLFFWVAFEVAPLTYLRYSVHYFFLCYMSINQNYHVFFADSKAILLPVCLAALKRHFVSRLHVRVAVNVLGDILKTLHQDQEEVGGGTISETVHVNLRSLSAAALN